MAVNVPGIVAVSVFYLIILVIGILARWKSRHEEKKCSADQTEVAMIGGRNMGLLVGIFTTTATFVGGGYIMVIAEVVYHPSRGLSWAIFPPAFCFGLIIGGLIFAKPIRSNRNVTMMDTIQKQYGNVMNSLLFLLTLLDNIIVTSVIFNILGSSISILLGTQRILTTVGSACVVILYTLMGSFYSVTYTDVIQLILITVGLWCFVPFAIMNPAVGDIKYTMLNELYQSAWIGKIEINHIGRWIDDFLYLTMVTFSWEPYFQRVLAAASDTQAQIISCVSGVLCLVMGFPSIIAGAIAVSTDWNQTSYGLPTPYERQETSNILFIVLDNLSPSYIAVIGNSAISAAIMSSADSILLATSSVFARNIYKKTIRKEASAREVMWAMRITIVLLGAIGTLLGLLFDSVFQLWFLCAELTYSILFPQLTCVLFIPNTNAYGSAAGYLTGITMRVLAGEPAFHLPPIIQYPGISFENGTFVHLFPFRTFTMLLSLLSIVVFSYLATFLFERKLLPTRLDVFKITDNPQEVAEGPEEEIALHQIPDSGPDRKRL